jgi:hypothetical protein
MMNGRPLGVQFKRNSAYVAQEDCFVPTMSAWETLVFTATLTLPKAVDPEERRMRIEEVLKIMGLWRSRDTQVRVPPALPAPPFFASGLLTFVSAGSAIVHRSRPPS